MSEKPQYTNADLARGAFGFMIILAVLWAAGGVIYSNITGINYDWLRAFTPLFLVLLIQVLLSWVHATIKSAVSEGYVLGIASYQIQEELRKKRVH